MSGQSRSVASLVPPGETLLVQEVHLPESAKTWGFRDLSSLASSFFTTSKSRATKNSQSAGRQCEFGGGEQTSNEPAQPPAFLFEEVEAENAQTLYERDVSAHVRFCFVFQARLNVQYQHSRFVFNPPPWFVQLEAAVRRSLMPADPSAIGRDPFRNNHQVTPPRNDVAGRLVTQGSLSQYSFHDGRAACTPIALEAAWGLLVERPPLGLLSITAEDLNEFVQRGVERYRNVRHYSQTNQHSSVDELWEDPACADLVYHLEKGAPLQGSVANLQELICAFQACLDFAAGCDRLAIVLTKSGETVLCVTDLQSSPSGWYLFDSHGLSHENPKLAYWKEFGSFHRLLDAFQLKYPPQDFGDGSLQSEMYNLFEAFPIVHRRQELDDAIEVTQVVQTTPTEEPCKVVTPPAAALRTREENTGTCSLEDPKVPPAPSTVPSDIFDKTDLTCAISMEIMADPVVCSDGMHYDRPNIERFFDTLRVEEEQRMAEEEARARGESPEPSSEEEREAATTCCNTERRPILLISPTTGEVVDGTLTPVKYIERQIVRLVESNAFMMTDEEIDDWHKRRSEKLTRDEERQEERRLALERQEEMRRNAVEAERRRADDDLPQEPSLQVRVDRDINDDQERLSNEDLGISVVLSDKVHRIPARHASQLQQSQTPRCMVACCAAPLNSNQWCSRCARIVCDDCLSFGATDLHEMHHAPEDLRRLCFECVSQVVDAMNSDNIRVRQRRAILNGSLETYLAQLSNRAATKQDDMVRHDVHDEFGGRMEEVESEIVRLEGELQTLQDQVQEQDRLAEDATVDNEEARGSTMDDNLVELRRQYDALEQEYSECLQEEPTGEDGAFQLMIRRSDLFNRLEIAGVNVAVAESAVSSESVAAPDLVSPSDTQSELERLQQRLAELTNHSNEETEETEEEQIERVIENSAIISRIEELTTRVAMSRSLERSVAASSSQCSTNEEDPSPTPTAVDLSVHTADEDLLEEFIRLSNLDISELSEEAQMRHTIRLSEVDSILRSAEEELFRNQQEVIPSTASAVEARQDLSAIGRRLSEWPLPLGLVFPTELMERQLALFRNTLELRMVESRRNANSHMTEQYNMLVAHRDELEDQITETRQTLQDAELHARQEESRRQQRAERRRLEEAAQRERERQLCEEAQRARQAAGELLRQHAAAEAATAEIFANARVEGGAHVLGGTGDLRMCRRCRAGPVENIACSDLETHNNASIDYKGNAVTSVENPNACPHCGWFNSNWHRWPYWDGIHGPH